MQGGDFSVWFYSFAWGAHYYVSFVLEMLLLFWLQPQSTVLCDDGAGVVYGRRSLQLPAQLRQSSGT